MQYVSPFTLLKDQLPEVPGNNNLLLAKRKLLAELELAGNTYVIVNGRHLQKNDIVTLFDSLSHPGVLSYHAVIAEDVILRKFLETNVLQPGDKFIKKVFYSDGYFLQWISPYFCHSFITLAKKCLKEKDASAWVALMECPLVMTAGDMEKAFAEIENIIKADIEALRQLLKTKGKLSKEVFKLITAPPYITILQQLPIERFKHLQNQFAFTISRVAIHVFNKKKRLDGINIMKSAMLIAQSEELGHELSSVLFQMEKIFARTRSIEVVAGRISLWLVLIFIIIAIVLTILDQV